MGAIEDIQVLYSPQPLFARKETGMDVGRRSWIKSIGAAAAGGALLSEPAYSEPAGRDSIVASSSTAVTQTAAGKVRGYVRNGIYTFKGIPYGAPVSSDRRFMPPAKPDPWTGVRSSLTYGFVSPQARRREWVRDELAWIFQWDDGVQGEDCLRVNVWTPGINDNRKRPVMVWLHGGGFSMGSGHELRSYDGENLARRGDVVMVSLNHRLGAAGFLNLFAIGGEKYAVSANAGMLDIVAALEWVRDNIRNFGGDPENVTVFGQSGGGGKINVLMSMPRARGLFHKAIVQSGSLTRMPVPELTEKLAASVLKELDITKENLAQLHTVPFERLAAAGEAAAKSVFPPPDFSRPFDFKRHGEILPWAPTVDGAILPEQPFQAGSAAARANVPMIIGSTMNEIGAGFDDPEAAALPNEELMRRIAAGHGSENAARILEALRRGHPGAKPSELFTIWCSSGFRRSAIDQAVVKAAQGAAPVYVYWFAWHTAVLDGRPFAFHGSEMPFVFDNTDRCDTVTGGGPAARTLAAKVSEAWIRFARTGDPNHSGLPRWPPFTPGKRTTMIFDNTSAAKDDPDGEELKALAG
jgi:para-nitrobenzyl esterase